MILTFRWTIKKSEKTDKFFNLAIELKMLWNMIVTVIEIIIIPLERSEEKLEGGWLVGWLVGFYGISTFVGYLTPKSFL